MKLDFEKIILILCTVIPIISEIYLFYDARRTENICIKTPNCDYAFTIVPYIWFSIFSFCILMILIDAGGWLNKLSDRWQAVIMLLLVNMFIIFPIIDSYYYCELDLKYTVPVKVDCIEFFKGQLFIALFVNIVVVLLLYFIK